MKFITLFRVRIEEVNMVNCQILINKIIAKYERRFFYEQKKYESLFKCLITYVFFN